MLGARRVFERRRRRHHRHRCRRRRRNSDKQVYRRRRRVSSHRQRAARASESVDTFLSSFARFLLNLCADAAARHRVSHPNARSLTHLRTSRPLSLFFKPKNLFEPLLSFATVAKIVVVREKNRSMNQNFNQLVFLMLVFLTMSTAYDWRARSSAFFFFLVAAALDSSALFASRRRDGAKIKFALVLVICVVSEGKMRREAAVRRRLNSSAHRRRRLTRRPWRRRRR